MMRKTILPLFFIILALIVFGAGFYFGQSQIPITPPEGIVNTELGKPEAIDFSLFWEAWRKLEEKFVDPEKINYQNMLYGAISGMAGSLKDPYTIYLPPEDSKVFKEDVSGEFQGVGMEIGIRKGELTIIAPLEGTPASRAGLRAGDKIIKIGDTYTGDLTVEEAVKLIRGPKGTEVSLTIFREGWPETKEFKIIREMIEIPSLKWQLKDEKIAHIRLYHFSQAGRTAFQQAAIEILSSPAESIILDLRNNPGGYLEVAQEISGWFLEKDQIVTIEDFGGKEKQKPYQAKGNEALLPYPLVVLINQGSASGSEILAGALRDNRQVLLIGEKSFGKGSVQELAELKEGSLKITIAKWLTPKREVIDGVGLTPDIEVPMTEADYNEDRDPQLDKAIEALKELR